jgi:hypothetical protein
MEWPSPRCGATSPASSARDDVRRRIPRADPPSVRRSRRARAARRAEQGAGHVPVVCAPARPLPRRAGRDARRRRNAASRQHDGPVVLGGQRPRRALVRAHGVGAGRRTQRPPDRTVRRPRRSASQRPASRWASTSHASGTRTTRGSPCGGCCDDALALPCSCWRPVRRNGPSRASFDPPTPCGAARCEPAALAPDPWSMRRLGKAEYANSVKPAFGLDEVDLSLLPDGDPLRLTPASVGALNVLAYATIADPRGRSGARLMKSPDLLDWVRERTFFFSARLRVHSGAHAAPIHGRVLIAGRARSWPWAPHHRRGGPSSRCGCSHRVGS